MATTPTRLWLCAHLPRLPLEALNLPPSDVPRAVCAKRGSRRWVVCADRHDPALTPGAEAAAAQALVPGLELLQRSARAERSALHAAAAAAWDVGQPVSTRLVESREAHGIPCALAWVEVGASLRLFGGLAACRDALARDLSALGHAHAFGVAPTPEGAALLARAGVAETPHTLAELRAVLEPMPADWLMLPEGALDSVRGTGLSTIGEVLAVPRDAWARRFANDTLSYLDRLTGRAPDPLRAWRPPPRYARRLELPHEVTSTQGLLFPLKRMLNELAVYLRARDTGTTEVEVALEHDDGPPTLQWLRLMAPTRDPAHLWAVARERIERMQATQPVQALVLRAQRFAEPDAPQYDLFDPQARDGGAWRELVERLTARLGPDAVTGLGLAAGHRPERCWTVVPPGGKVAEAAEAGAIPDRPVWLIDPPRPLARPPNLLGPPERIESGWWDGGDVRRDYYRAEAGGARLWVYRDRDSRQWFLHGLWA